MWTKNVDLFEKKNRQAVHKKWSIDVFCAIGELPSVSTVTVFLLRALNAVFLTSGKLSKTWQDDFLPVGLIWFKTHALTTKIGGGDGVLGTLACQFVVASIIFFV